MNAKLDTGRVFERIFAFYGSQFTLLIPAALLLFLPVALVNGLLLSGDGVGAIALLLSFAIGIAATYWYQGMVVEATVDILDGRRDHTIGSLFSSAAPFIVPLLAAGFLAGLGILIGFVLLIVPGLILLTLWAVIVPAIVIERIGVFDSFGRSRALVRDNGWRVFGVIVVLFIINLVVGGLIRGIIGGLTDDSFGGYVVADLLVNVLVVPLSALAATVVYVELRRIKGEPLAMEAGGQAPAPLPPQQAPQPATEVRDVDPAGPEAPQAPGPQAPGPQSPPGPEAPPR